MKRLWEKIQSKLRKEVIILIPSSEENQTDYFFKLHRPEGLRKLQENISEKEDR